MIHRLFRSSTQGAVCTVHILSTGELVRFTLDSYQKVEDRFAWVDKKEIISKLLSLRKVTDEGKKSIIAIYENGQEIREFINVEEDFSPLFVKSILILLFREDLLLVFQ